jgi:ABC-type phosphate transport system substrate-binding protein
MRATRAILLMLALLAVASTLSRATARADAPGGAAGFQVIVNPANPVASVERRFVLDAFLKKVTRWPHDELIRPADLDADSTVRRRFSEQILRRSVAAVKSYWQQLVFSGRDVPPPELDSEWQLVRYVLKYPGAIGYVSTGANLEGAKVLTVR